MMKINKWMVNGLRTKHAVKYGKVRWKLKTENNLCKKTMYKME